MKKHVVVHSYEKTWADDFVAIRDELNTVLKDLVLRIEHVGSTSVEGLSAKPIIDIDVVRCSKTGNAVQILVKISYISRNIGYKGRYRIHQLRDKRQYYDNKEDQDTEEGEKQ